jgi:hypothetical protein
MTNIAGRLKKITDAIEKIAPEEGMPVYFIRIGDENLDIPGEDQLIFQKENPDYNGLIYVMLIGNHPDSKGR